MFSQMASIQSISIVDHTTGSIPTPHVLYIVKVTLEDGEQHEVQRRYSQVGSLNIVV